MGQKNRETAFTVRCDIDLKENAEASADEKGQSLVEWVRRAMKEKLEREKSGVSDAELEATIRKVLEQMQSERK